MTVTLLVDANASALHTLQPQREWRDSRVQCIKRLHNSDSPPQPTHALCLHTGVRAHRAYPRTDRPESCEGDALTLPRVTNWENQVAEVARAEEGGGRLACQFEAIGWKFSVVTLATLDTLSLPAPGFTACPLLLPSASSLLHKSFVIVSYVSAVRLGPE